MNSNLVYKSISLLLAPGHNASKVSLIKNENVLVSYGPREKRATQSRSSAFDERRWTAACCADSMDVDLHCSIVLGERRRILQLYDNGRRAGRVHEN